MSRPLRIEFNGAYYHVMNRGAGRQDIFARDAHRHLFLELLRETHEMFRAEVHAYCLMDNHYHLLVSTPEGNLNRIMRHLNGVYTQRYNRLEKTDGPLFRGRYKAILVDVDAYLLNVSRYIHLNPVSANIVKQAHGYRWSSYRAYIGKTKPSLWLNTEQTLKKNHSPILGRPAFVKKMQKRIQPDQEIPQHKQLRPPVSLAQVVQLTAREFGTAKAQLLQASRGRGHANVARTAAMYVSRTVAGYSLNEIAEYFGLNAYGSVSGQLHRFRQVLGGDGDIERVVNRLHKMIKEQT